MTLDNITELKQKIGSVHVTHNVEASNHTVTASNGHHISVIIKVRRVHGSAKICDRGSRLEVVATIENLSFVCHCTASHNQVTAGLLELS